MTALVGTFTTTGQSVAVGTTAQASGITSNDFTNPIMYTVTAADLTTQAYTVSVVSVALEYATAGLHTIDWGDGVVIQGTKLAVFLYAPAGTQLDSNAGYKAYCENMGFEQNQDSRTNNNFVAAGMSNPTDYYCADFCCYLGQGNDEARNLTDFRNFGLPLFAPLEVFDRGCGDLAGDYNHGINTSDTLTTDASTLTYTSDALGPRNLGSAKTTTFSQDGVVVCQAK